MNQFWCISTLFFFKIIQIIERSKKSVEIWSIGAYGIFILNRKLFITFLQGVPRQSIRLYTIFSLKSVLFKNVLGKIAWPQKFTKTAPLISFISTGQFLWIFGWNDFPKYVLKKIDFTICTSHGRWVILDQYTIASFHFREHWGISNSGINVKFVHG